MSAIAALIELDGAPAAEARLRALIADMAWRGPESPGVRTAGSAGVGHGLLRTLPEDGPQPVTDPGGSILLALDGRLDNRADLAALGGVEGVLDGWSDASLLAAAYARMGDAVFARVDGDFAVVIWDTTARRLLAARDLFGLRPLYHRTVGRTLLVASDIGALQRDRPADPDEGVVAEALSGWRASPTATLARGVSRVPPGHVLVADAGGVALRRFAELSAPTAGPHRSIEACVDELAARLADAVRARLRCDSRVGVMLSGGIDSSSVFATARATARDGAVDAYTVSHEGELDESGIARRTVDMHGGRHVVAPSGAASFDYAADARHHLDLPVHPSGANPWILRQRAATDGVRVLLNGVGADEWFGGHRWHQADLLVSGRWATLWRAYQRERRLADRFTGPQFIMQTLVPLLPRPVKRLGRLVTGGAIPAFVRPEWARRVNLTDRLRQRPEMKGPTHALRGMLMDNFNGPAIAAADEQDRLAALAGTDDRYPYFDRHLVEFALGLPEGLNMGTAVPKALVRDTFRDRLPRGLADRFEGPDYACLTRDALDSLGGREFFDGLLLEDAGWVDGAVLRGHAARMWRLSNAGDDAYRSLVDPLWSVAATELWLRAVRGASISARPRGAVA